jgi:hypothetical protein
MQSISIKFGHYGEAIAKEMIKTNPDLELLKCGVQAIDKKGKKKDIDFHSVKHNNKEKDTLGFFQLFFTKYIEKVNIDKCSVFIFILKRINNYDNILSNILNIYQQFKIKFILIEDEYENKLIDKNKDDFMCQYIFFLLFKNFKNCILISNDKYRDKLDYIKLFDFNINLKVMNKFNNSDGKPINDIHSVSFSINKNILFLMENNACIRCTIPKHKLNQIL